MTNPPSQYNLQCELNNTRIRQQPTGTATGWTGACAMTLIFYVVLGLIAGALAKLILPGRQGGGIIATIILGIVGALVGGLLGNLIIHGSFSFALSGSWFWSLVTAVVGSIVVLLIYGFVRRRSAE